MPGTASKKIFVNLPVRDLGASVAFFTALGFGFDARFTDENATCMVVSDDAFVMLLVEHRFADFTRKAICDATTSTEAIIALSADSRAQVDDLVHRALAAGAGPRTIRWTTGSCTDGASRIPTVTCGSSLSWSRTRRMNQARDRTTPRVAGVDAAMEGAS
ncbi:MAG TPA: hypothetical protein VKP64_15895 [Mycobacteriales bacterium]|nr:hypothetical protein [Mycobacteriales bacterium]